MKKFVKTASQGFTKPAKLSSQGIIKAASHTFLELTFYMVCLMRAAPCCAVLRRAAPCCPVLRRAAP